MSILVIDSSKRTSGDPWAGTVEIPRGLNLKSLNLRLQSFTTAFAVFNVDESAYKVDCYDGTGNFSIELPFGSYTVGGIADIGNAVAKALTKASESYRALVFTSTYSPITNRYTIQSTGNFILKFGTGTNQVYKQLGFIKANTSFSNSATGTVLPRLYDNSMYLSFNIGPREVSVTGSSQPFNFVFDRADFGEAITYDATSSSPPMYWRLPNLPYQVSWSFTNSSGELLKQQADWTATFVSE